MQSYEAYEKEEEQLRGKQAGVQNGEEEDAGDKMKKKCCECYCEILCYSLRLFC